VKIGLCCELLGSMHLPSDQVTDMELCKSLSQDLLFWLAGWLAGWLVEGTANQVNKDHIKLNLNMSRASNAILPNAKHYPCPRRAEIWSIVLIYISCARMIYFIIQFNYATSLARCACALFFFFLLWMSGPAYVHLD